MRRCEKRAKTFRSQQAFSKHTIKFHTPRKHKRSSPIAGSTNTRKAVANRRYYVRKQIAAGQMTILDWVLTGQLEPMSR